MSKIIPRTLKGFRDFLPKEAIQRRWLRDVMTEVCESWGYEPLETPTIEPLELFAGQIGEDEKLFFKFKDQGDRDVALRYDQTVPTCRVIGQYADRLIYPFRRYHMQSAFRAEKPQKGRYREFTQFDIDIFGISSPLADAEVIAVTLEIYKKIGFKNAVALVNNRDLMKDVPYTAIASIDKLKKLGEEGVIEEMVKKGIEKDRAVSYVKYVQNIRPDNTIKTIFDYLRASGFSNEWYTFEPTLARSFSYSQGPIWEIVIPEAGESSVGGGERYDALIEKISGQRVPGTGIGIGFDRTLEAALSSGLVPDFQSVSRVLVTVFSKELWNESMKIAEKIRKGGVPAELYPDPEVRLDKQLKYADKKNIPYVVIAGPEEAKNNTIILKDMRSGEQKNLKLEELIIKFKT